MTEHNLPLYQIIEEYIAGKIEDETYPVGSQIPKERELCEMFNASRMTVSKALNNLVMNGMIYRNQGKGTFVRMRYPESRALHSMLGFSEDMKRIGKDALSQVKEYKVIHADSYPTIQHILQLNDKEYMHRLVRLRLADGQPLAAEFIFLSATSIPSLDIRILEKSLYDYIENTLHLKIKYSNEKMQAVNSTEQVDEIFGENIKEPLFKITRISYLENDIPFQVSETFYIGSKYEYNLKTIR